MAHPWIRRLVPALLALGLVVSSGWARAQSPPLDRAAVVAEATRLDKEAGRLYQADKLDDAMAVAERELALTEKALGPTDWHTANARSSVGGLWLAKGDYLKAEPLLRQALEVFDQAKDVDVRDHAGALVNLGILYAAKGQARVARPFLERALGLAEAASPSDPTFVGETSGALANVLVPLRETRRAMELLDKAIALLDKPGSEKLLAINLLRKADLLRRLAMPRAEPLYQRAIELIEHTAGPESLLVAQARRRYARYAWGGGGAFDGGEKLYQSAFTIVEKVLGPKHPDLADLMCEWAVGKQLQGDLMGALDLRKRADVIDEHHLRLLLAAGSEEDKRAYAARLYQRTEDAVGLSLTLGQASAEARRFAFTMVLRRKGRVLDALTDERLALRRHLAPEHAALLADLAATRTELANLVLRGPGLVGPTYRAQVAVLEEREKKAESAASAASTAYRTATTPPTVEAIARALPAGSALVEILRFEPTAIHSLVEARLPPVYIAFVLLPGGAMHQLHLSNASTVDALAHRFRQALASPQRRDVLDLGARLYTATLARLEGLLGSTRQVILAPDGELNLIPFAALADAKGNWLVNRYTFTYLSSGRDLLRLLDPSPRSQAPVIIANPAYGDAKATPATPARTSSRGLSLDDLAHVHFPSLPGTQVEADAIRALLPGATVLTGEAATKSALRALSSPAVLHIATHGFSLGGDPRKSERDTRGLELDPDAPTTPRSTSETDARFQSGIALAGANLRRAGNDDGVLTALEAASLDLSGTRLVVLSACETGVGDLSRGEGVYSLRRAFVEAGAETQVMSLWQVDDDATRELMAGYYKGLFREGKGRSAALHEQQLAMLAGGVHHHPYYWASFIVSGDPSPIAIPLVSMPPVTPTARGCACLVASPGSTELGPPALLIALGLLLAARRTSPCRVAPRPRRGRSCRLIAPGRPMVAPPRRGDARCSPRRSRPPRPGR